MPNRWERINGNLVPKNFASTVTAESVQTFPDYSYRDDFGYQEDTAVNLKYAAQSGDTLSYVATGTNDVSGGSSPNTAGFLLLGAGNLVDATKKLTFKARVQLTDADTELFSYIGCFETTPTVADPPVLADDYVAFEMVEVTSNANWNAICGDDVGGSGAETSVDTGVVIDLDPHDFEIVVDNGVATFKIDGAIVATIDTNLPLVAILQPTIKVTTGDANAKGITADVLSVVNAR